VRPKQVSSKPKYQGERFLSPGRQGIRFKRLNPVFRSADLLWAACFGLFSEQWIESTTSDLPSKTHTIVPIPARPTSKYLDVINLVIQHVGVMLQELPWAQKFFMTNTWNLNQSTLGRTKSLWALTTKIANPWKDVRRYSVEVFVSGFFLW